MLFKEDEVRKIMTEMINIKDRYDSFFRRYLSDVIESVNNPDYFKFVKEILDGMKTNKKQNSEIIKKVPNNFDLLAVDLDTIPFKENINKLQEVFNNVGILNVANCAADFLFVLEQLIVRCDTQIDVLKKKILSKHFIDDSETMKGIFKTTKYSNVLDKLKKTRNAIVHNNNFIDDELKEQVVFGDMRDLSFLMPYFDNLNEYMYSVLFTVLYSVQFINHDVDILDFVKDSSIFEKIQITEEDKKIIKVLYNRDDKIL